MENRGAVRAANDFLTGAILSSRSALFFMGRFYSDLDRQQGCLWISRCELNISIGTFQVVIVF